MIGGNGILNTNLSLINLQLTPTMQPKTASTSTTIYSVTTGTVILTKIKVQKNKIKKRFIS